jgi:hypothetical protein
MASSLRSWRVSLLRQRAHFLGIVETPDEKAAEPLPSRNFSSMTSNANAAGGNNAPAQRGRLGRGQTNREHHTADSVA